LGFQSENIVLIVLVIKCIQQILPKHYYQY